MGNGVSLGMTLLMSFALAGLISRERLSWDQVGYGILILLFLSALLGAATSVKAVKRQRLMIAMGSGLLFWATLIACFLGDSTTECWSQDWSFWPPAASWH